MQHQGGVITPAPCVLLAPLIPGHDLMLEMAGPVGFTVANFPLDSSKQVPIQQLDSDEILRAAKSLFETLLGCGPDARRAHEACHNMLRVECVYGILGIAASHDNVPGLVTRSAEAPFPLSLVRLLWLWST